MAIPTEQVLGLRQQGLSNNQVIDVLQRQGFTYEEVLDALHQADIKQQIRPTPTNMEPQNPMPFDQNAYQQQDPQYAQQYAQFPDMGQPGGLGVSREQIEEIAEAIIDEKWSALIENVNRIIEWKEKTDGRLAQMEARLNDLKLNFDSLQGAVLERVGEYDKHIQDVGTEVQALEKVFQKILPGFIENVSRLDTITQRMSR